MYRILTISLLLISLIWFWHLLKKNGLNVLAVPGLFSKSFKETYNSFMSQDKKNIKATLQSLKPFLFLTTFILFLALFSTSIIPVIISGESLSGIVLLLHVAVTPLFSLLLAGTIIIYARSNVFSADDLKSKNNPLSFSLSGYKKLLFWLIAITAIFVMLPITLSMFPLFGIEGQLFLWGIHKYSVLIFTGFIILHSGLVIILMSNK